MTVITAGLFKQKTGDSKADSKVTTIGFAHYEIQDSASFGNKTNAIKELIKKQSNPEIFFDVVQGLAGHKSLDVQDLIKRTYEMTEMQISVLKEMMVNQEWDFFMAVMIGTDRLQHMIWRHFDPTHRRAILNSPYKEALKEYYIFLQFLF